MITDQVEKIIRDALRRRKRYAIYAKTGSGKTYATIHTLYKLVQEGKRCMMIFPYKALKLDVKSQYKNMVTESLQEARRKVFITCPERLEFLGKFPYTFDIYVLDEAHLVPKMFTYRVAYKRLESYFRGKPVVYLTGTPISNKAFPYRIDKEFNLGVKINHVVNFHVINKSYRYGDEEISTLVPMANWYKDKGKFVVVYSNAKQTINIAKYDMLVCSETVKYKNLDRFINTKQTVHSMLENQELDTEVVRYLYVTESFTTGININNEINEKLHMFVDDFGSITVHDIYQAINRFRKLTEKEVDVYVKLADVRNGEEDPDLENKLFNMLKKMSNDHFFGIASMFSPIVIRDKIPYVESFPEEKNEKNKYVLIIDAMGKVARYCSLCYNGEWKLDFYMKVLSLIGKKPFKEMYGSEPYAFVMACAIKYIDEADKTASSYTMNKYNKLNKVKRTKVKWYYKALKNLLDDWTIEQKTKGQWENIVKQAARRIDKTLYELVRK